MNISLDRAATGTPGRRTTRRPRRGSSPTRDLWANELARYGIRTGAIAPGFVDTPILQGMQPEVLEGMLRAGPAAPRRQARRDLPGREVHHRVRLLHGPLHRRRRWHAHLIARSAAHRRCSPTSEASNSGASYGSMCVPSMRSMRGDGTQRSCAPARRRVPALARPHDQHRRSDRAHELEERLLVEGRRRADEVLRVEPPRDLPVARRIGAVLGEEPRVVGVEARDGARGDARSRRRERRGGCATGDARARRGTASFARRMLESAVGSAPIPSISVSVRTRSGRAPA